MWLAPVQFSFAQQIEITPLSTDIKNPRAKHFPTTDPPEFVSNESSTSGEAETPLTLQGINAGDMNVESSPVDSINDSGSPVFIWNNATLKPKHQDYPSVRVTGFAQADLGLFGQDSANIATVGDIQDGADFRRTRLAATGDVWKNVDYMIEMDFSFPGRPSFMDVYMGISELPIVGNFRVGQWRQPFGMDALTSVRELTFLERALPFAFVPFRQIGAGIFNHNKAETVTWAVSGFRYPTDPFGGNVGDDGGYGMTGRVTFLPIYYENDCLFHVGGNYSYIDPANNRSRFLNQPEFFVGETAGALAPIGLPLNVPPFVDTGIIPTHNLNLFGVELAGQWRQLYVQSEFIITSVGRIGESRVTFPGAYVYAGYFLTGEIRPYNKKKGVFGRVVPHNNFWPGQGCGAWEVAGRWSYIDLNSNDVRGGRLNDVTFGLNWYLNKHAKFQFNYIHAFLDRAPGGNSNADIIAWRAQVDF